MPVAQEWLPEAALSDGQLERAVEDVLRAWAEKWFAQAPSLRVVLQTAPHGLPSLPADQGWASPDGALRLLPSARARQRIAREALGFPGQFQDRKAEDLRLMQSLSARLLQDLGERAESVFPGAGALQMNSGDEARSWPLHGGGISISASLFGEDGIFVFFCSRDLAIRARKAMLTAPIPRQLAPLKRGLDGQEVSLSGLAGTTRLTLAEFRAMQPGDVLSLDRTLSEGIPISLNRRAVLSLVSDAEIDGPQARLRIRGAA